MFKPKCVVLDKVDTVSKAFFKDNLARVNTSNNFELLNQADILAASPVKGNVATQTLEVSSSRIRNLDKLIISAL